MIGDVRYEERCADPWNFCDFVGYPFQPILPFMGQSFMVLCEKKLEGFDHSHNFFFAHLLASALCIFVRAVVQ